MQKTNLAKPTGRRGPTPVTARKRANGQADVGLCELLDAMHAMRDGDFSVRIPGHHDGIIGKIADAFNEVVAANERIANQLEHVGEAVGREGRTRQRVKFGLNSAAWGEMEASVNSLIDDL